MRTSTAMPLQLNRVYLPIVGFTQEFEFGQEYEFNNARGMFRDVTSFEFIVEALIAHSASEIALESYGQKNNDLILDKVPRTLRKRIKFIDARNAMRLANAVFSPVFEEHYIEPYGYELRHPSIEGGQLDNQLRDDIFYSWAFLYEFLLGTKYKLEVDIDIEHFTKAVSTIRQKSKNPESRANMSILEGILSLYGLNEIEGLRIIPQVSKEQKESFIRFLEDLDYEELSKANFGLGLPLQFKKYAVKISQLVRRIVSNDMFSLMFEACSRSLTVATKVPMPSSDLVETIVPSSYLPPIVSLKQVLHQAHEAWKRSVEYETLAKGRKWCVDIFELR